MTEYQMKPIAERRGVAVYSQNPFMPAGIKAKGRRVMSQRGNMMMVNGETGELTATTAGFWEVEEIDSSRFVKLFVNGVKALQGLTSSGTKVFEVLYMQILENFGKDKVDMVFAMVNQDITPMSEATYNRGMRELIEKGFIAATPMQGKFWLNPDYIWNGDRLAFVKEYRRAAEKPKLSKDTQTLDLFERETEEEAKEKAALMQAIAEGRAIEMVEPPEGWNTIEPWDGKEDDSPGACNTARKSL